MDCFESYYPGRINCKEIFPEDSAIEKVFPLKEHRLTINVDIVNYYDTGEALKKKEIALCKSSI